MKNKRLFTLFSITIIFVFITSLVSTVNVLADDSTPPAPTEEPALPPTEESAAETEPAPTSAPEADTPAEILQSAPEGVDVVVLDQNGEPMSLATEEAAQIIMAGDPMWCPDSVTPGTDTFSECTESYSSFATLIANLGFYSGSGTIYVAWDYDYTLDGDVVFDQGDSNLDELDDLTIQGGWNFTDDDIDTLQSYSNLGDNSLTITNWIGNVTINNIFISGANPSNPFVADAALSIDTGGDVELNDVTVEDTIQGMGIYIETDENVTMENVESNNNGLEGALIVDADNVTINDSEFSDNGYFGYEYANEYYGADGLDVIASGLVTLNNVIAEDNAMNGAYIVGNSVEITSSGFSGNGWYGGGYYYSYSSSSEMVLEEEFYSGEGLYVDSQGDITLYDVCTCGNAGSGAELFSEDGDIWIEASSFDDNGGQGDIDLYISIYNDEYLDAEFSLNYEAGDGLIVETYQGNITLTDVSVSYNANNGADISTKDGNVEIVDAVFYENGWSSGYFDYDYCDGDPQCEDGYDFLEYALVDEFCDNLPTSFYGTFFNPCEDNGYIEVQGSNFSYDVNMDSFQNEYEIEQSGGTGLEVDAYNGTVTLSDIDVYDNAGYGADIYGENGASVENSVFEQNGHLGDFSLREACYSEGMQSLYGYGDCIYSDDEPIDYSYSASFGYEYGDGLHIDIENGTITLNQVDAIYNANSGALIHADEDGSSVFIEDSEFSYNFYPIYIGGESGLFGSFLYDLTMGDFDESIEIPASELYLDISTYKQDDNGGFNIYLELNSGIGLDAEADASLTLDGVTANGNGGDGAQLYSGNTANISDSDFNGNGFGLDGYMAFGANANDGTESEYYETYTSSGSGFDLESNGSITLNGVTATNNALYGAEIYGDTSVFVEESEFSNNGWGGYGSYDYYYTYGHYEGDPQVFVVDYEDEYSDEWYGSGLYIDTDGNITLIEVTANENYQDGAEVYSNGGRVIVSCGQYNNNADYGIYEDGASSLELYGPEIFDNGYTPDEYYFSNSVIVSEDCTIPEDEKKPVEAGAPICAGDVATTTFFLPNGDFVVFPCPINDFAVVRPLVEKELPAVLAEGQKFLSSLSTKVMRDNQSIEELEKPVIVSFLIPKDVDKETLAIIFWNGTEWIDLGGEVSNDELYFEISTKLVGIFVLVSK